MSTTKSNPDGDPTTSANCDSNPIDDLPNSNKHDNNEDGIIGLRTMAAIADPMQCGQSEEDTNVSSVKSFNSVSESKQNQNDCSCELKSSIISSLQSLSPLSPSPSSPPSEKKSTNISTLKDAENLQSQNLSAGLYQTSSLLEATCAQSSSATKTTRTVSVPSCITSKTPNLIKKKRTNSRKRTASLDSNSKVPHKNSSYSSSINSEPSTASVVKSFTNLGDASRDGEDSGLERGVTEAAKKNLQQESAMEMERVSCLLASGLTLANSSNITILHLSLILGRASQIKLEYEFKDTTSKADTQNLPAFCRVASQMANVLRRLCDVAQVEITNLPQDMVKLF